MDEGMLMTEEGISKYRLRWVDCINCGVRGPIMGDVETAIQKWNRRNSDG